MSRYFELMDDLYIPERWYLADPVDRHGAPIRHLLTSGDPLQIEAPVRVQFNEFAPRGKPLDYTELDAAGAPVVHVKVAEIFSRLAPSDVQLIPVEIEGQPDQFVLVNIIRVVKCIDDERSDEVKYYTPDCEPIFRDRVGRYRSVIGMKIDPTKVGDAKIFRPWGWRVVIVVSEEIKNALEQIHAVGAKFEEV